MLISRSLAPPLRSGQAPQRSPTVATIPGSVLKEGSCFRAIRIASIRDLSLIRVTAEEVVVVDNEEQLEVGSQHRKTSKRAKVQASVERRKVMMASTFAVSAPAAHLVLREISEDTTVIDVEQGNLPEMVFDAMRFKPGLGYTEVNATEVLLGLDPSDGGRWITPAAWKHLVSVREAVWDAGGIFLAEFDVSTGGWARVKWMYVSPSPTDKIDYFHLCKTKPTSWCLNSHVVLPLICDGGRVFTRRFSPASSNLVDPV